MAERIAAENAERQKKEGEMAERLKAAQEVRTTFNTPCNPQNKFKVLKS